MSGIYIHIPFCKQACHYCDFHFSTSLKKKDEMLLALAKEIELRKKEFEHEIVVSLSQFFKIMGPTGFDSERGWYVSRWCVVDMAP